MTLTLINPRILVMSNDLNVNRLFSSGIDFNLNYLKIDYLSLAIKYQIKTELRHG